jgi:hypothetical protein
MLMQVRDSFLSRSSISRNVAVHSDDAHATTMQHMVGVIDSVIQAFEAAVPMNEIMNFLLNEEVGVPFVALTLDSNHSSSSVLDHGLFSFPPSL